MTAPDAAIDTDGRDGPGGPDGHSAPDGPGVRPDALWESDAGSLPRDARRALVLLVKGPYLDAALHPELWNALLGARDAISARLADLFLELVVDLDRAVAFVRNVTAPEAQAPTVVRTLPLTFVDTVVLLHLRGRLVQARMRGEVVFVDRDEIDAAIGVYRPRASTDEAGWGKRVNASVEKMKKARLLQPTDLEDRYSVSPVLELVFGADEVAAVAAQYRAMLDEGLDPDAAASGSDAVPDDTASGPNGSDSSASSEDEEL